MSKKILFVEDDMEFYNLFSTALKMKGHTVSLASDPTLAVDTAKSQKPDLILLDIVMPDISGLDILAELKSDDETKDIKVIMLTNFGTGDNVKKAIDLGADEYVMKYNVTPNDLADKIDGYFGDGRGVTVTN